MEAVGTAASILAIAGAGIQISLKLITFADQISTAPQRIQDVGTDVSVTAGTLHELGELMKNSTGMFRRDQSQHILASSTRCKEIFEKLREILGKASQQLRDVHKSTAKSQGSSPKIKLSRMERMRWPFLQPSMESLRVALRDAKGTLTLILQVVHLRHAQTTASLNREEQNDLVRLIATMGRQQLASNGGGHRGLDDVESEGSISRDPSDIRTVLEAWSVTPNTLSDEAFQHFLITPIPVSQQQIVKEMNTSPQGLHEITSIVDSLSSLERDAILGRVLGNSRSDPDDSTIRSISSQSWTGSHDLFGKVTSRKFKLILERRVGISMSPRTKWRPKSPRGIDSQRYKMHNGRQIFPDPNLPAHDSFSDSEGDYETEAYTHGSNPSPAFKVHRRRRPAQASPTPSSSRPFNDGVWERKQKIDETRGKRYREAPHAKLEKEEMRRQHGWRNPHSQPWANSQPASELSDDDLVKSLLAQYTNFESGEPLVYDEPFIIPKRDPRPY